MTTLQKTIGAGLLLLSMAAGHPLRAEELPREFALEVNSANELLRQGNVDGAIAAYQRAQESAPSSPNVSYNLAVAQYRKGDLAAAARQFQSAAAADNDDLAARARFNLGNCDYVAALKLAEQDRPAAIERLQSAIGHYRSALDIDSSDADARANIELASQWIDKLRERDEQRRKQQQPNQQQNQQQQNQAQKNEQRQNQAQQNQPSSGKHDDQRQDKQQSGQGSDSQPREDKPQAQQDQSQAAQGNKAEQGKAQNQQPQHDQNQSAGEPSPQNHSDAHDQKHQEGTRAERKNDEATQRSSVSNRSGQDTATRRQGESPPPTADETADKQGKAAPKGTLSAARQSEQHDAKNQPVRTADEPSADGEMTAQEAEKMLQAIRDRDLIRRLRRQAAERNQHIPVDRDW